MYRFILYDKNKINSLNSRSKFFGYQETVAEYRSLASRLTPMAGFLDNKSTLDALSRVVKERLGVRHG
jgi:hypothetical protein